MTQSPENTSLRFSSFTFHEQAVQAIVGDKLCALDALELGGDILVVLSWLGNTEKSLRKPELVLPIKAVRHQVLSTDLAAPCKWAISVPLPMSLFDGTASRQLRRQFAVRNGPPLTLPLKTVRH
jgi:hypothetical protein